MTARPATDRWLEPHEERAWRAFLLMQDHLEAHLARQLQAESSLSLADYDVLATLSDLPEGRARILELARHLQWEKSRLSRRLTRLEERALVSREDCPSDARGAFAALTPAGLAALQEAAPGHVAAVRSAVFDVLDDAEVDALERISRKVLGRLDEGRLDEGCLGHLPAA